MASDCVRAFVDTNLKTHFLLPTSGGATIRAFQDAIEETHARLFPELGPKVHCERLQVYESGVPYLLDPHSLVQEVACGAPKLHVEAIVIEVTAGQREEQMPGEGNNAVRPHKTDPSAGGKAKQPIRGASSAQHSAQVKRPGPGASAAKGPKAHLKDRVHFSGADKRDYGKDNRCLHSNPPIQPEEEEPSADLVCPQQSGVQLSQPNSRKRSRMHTRQTQNRRLLDLVQPVDDPESEPKVKRRRNQKEEGSEAVDDSPPGPAKDLPPEAVNAALPEGPTHHPQQGLPIVPEGVLVAARAPQAVDLPAVDGLNGDPRDEGSPVDGEEGLGRQLRARGNGERYVKRVSAAENSAENGDVHFTDPVAQDVSHIVSQQRAKSKARAACRKFSALQGSVGKGEDVREDAGSPVGPSFSKRRRLATARMEASGSGAELRTAEAHQVSGEDNKRDMEFANPNQSKSIAVASSAKEPRLKGKGLESPAGAPGTPAEDAKAQGGKSGTPELEPEALVGEVAVTATNELPLEQAVEGTALAHTPQMQLTPEEPAAEKASEREPVGFNARALSDGEAPRRPKSRLAEERRGVDCTSSASSSSNESNSTSEESSSSSSEESSPPKEYGGKPTQSFTEPEKPVSPPKKPANVPKKAADLSVEPASGPEMARVPQKQPGELSAEKVATTSGSSDDEETSSGSSESSSVEEHSSSEEEHTSGKDKGPLKDGEPTKAKPVGGRKQHPADGNPAAQNALSTGKAVFKPDMVAALEQKCASGTTPPRAKDIPGLACDKQDVGIPASPTAKDRTSNPNLRELLKLHAQQEAKKRGIKMTKQPQSAPARLPAKAKPNQVTEMEAASGLHPDASKILQTDYSGVRSQEFKSAVQTAVRSQLVSEGYPKRVYFKTSAPAWWPFPLWESKMLQNYVNAKKTYEAMRAHYLNLGADEP